MALRFLVVEGNTRGARQAHRQAYGLTLSESYAEVIQGIEGKAICDIAFPTDEGANLPDAAGLLPLPTLRWPASAKGAR